MPIKQKTTIYVQKKSVYFWSWDALQRDWNESEYIDCPKGKKIAVVERWPLYIAMDRKSYVDQVKIKNRRCQVRSSVLVSTGDMDLKLSGRVITVADIVLKKLNNV